MQSNMNVTVPTSIMPVPSQDLDFKRHMSWSFLYVILLEVRGNSSFC